MTQEDKELLLKDLCARLPYGVIVDYKQNEFEIPHWKITVIYPETMNGWIGYNEKIGAGSKSGSRPFNIGEVKPYLRPMSSITEEEEKELEKITPLFHFNRLENIIYVGAQDDGFCYLTEMEKIITFLNAHHFDYRNLITKGLAIEATEENSLYK